MEDAERKKLRTIFEDLKHTIGAKDNLQEKIQRVTTLVSEIKHAEELVQAHEQLVGMTHEMKGYQTAFMLMGKSKLPDVENEKPFRSSDETFEIILEHLPGGVR